MELRSQSELGLSNVESIELLAQKIKILRELKKGEETMLDQELS